MSVDLAALRALAEQATPGPWFSVGPPWNAQGPPWINAGSEDPHGGEIVADFAATERDSYADAAFIAACDPQTVLALVEAVEAARQVERSRQTSITTLDGCEEVDGPYLDHLVAALAPFEDSR